MKLVDGFVVALSWELSLSCASIRFDLDVERCSWLMISSLSIEADESLWT